MQLSKTKPCCHGLFGIKCCSPGSPFKQSIPVLCSSNCTDLNFNNWGLWSLRWNLGVFNQFLWPPHGLNLRWACWDVHSWEDCSTPEYSRPTNWQNLCSKSFYLQKLLKTKIIKLKRCFKRFLNLTWLPEFLAINDPLSHTRIHVTHCLYKNINNSNFGSLFANISTPDTLCVWKCSVI